MTMQRVVGSAAVLASLLATASATEQTQAMLAEAMNFVARASSTSEVLTLNLTNLLILLVLKALIFGFGLFSVNGSGRSAHGHHATPSLFEVPSTTELHAGMCFFMWGSGDEGKLDCIQRNSCEDPAMADTYLQGGKMWYQIHKMMKVVPFDSKYETLMMKVKEAADYGSSGLDCANKYNY